LFKAKNRRFFAVSSRKEGGRVFDLFSVAFCWWGWGKLAGFLAVAAVAAKSAVGQG
jgi:hypothetical protein